GADIEHRGHPERHQRRRDQQRDDLTPNRPVGEPKRLGERAHPISSAMTAASSCHTGPAAARGMTRFLAATSRLPQGAMISVTLELFPIAKLLPSCRGLD